MLFGHMRNNQQITTIMEGKTGRGRPRIQFIKRIVKDIEITTRN